MQRTTFAILGATLLCCLACCRDGDVVGTDAGDVGNDLIETDTDTDAGDGDADVDERDTVDADDGDTNIGDADDSDTGPPAYLRYIPPNYGYPLDDTLRLNHLQAKGTHNSYHVEEEQSADDSHRYTHAPLTTQLEDYGCRAFELDVHQTGEDDSFEVYHLPFIDDETTCLRFVDCLQELRSWSDDNPGHHPLFVWLEMKDDIDFGAAIRDYDGLDAEIRSVWPDRVFTPDHLQGDASSIRARLEGEGWPTLGEMRDQIIFAMLDGEDHRARYTDDLTTLEGRMMFVHTSPGESDLHFAAVAKINDPASTSIPDAHSANLLVTSNIGSADSSDESNAARLATAIESGVQFLTGDFPGPVDGRSYFMDFEDGAPSRCNDVTAPGSCSATAVESELPRAPIP